MDYIHVKDMQFYGFHGVLQEETKLGQRFRVNVSLAVDTKRAGETDDLAHTVNYAEVYDLTRNIVEGKPFQLIEAVAEEIANCILVDYASQVRGIRVELIKPEVPIQGILREVSVEITRGQFV